MMMKRFLFTYLTLMLTVAIASADASFSVIPPRTVIEGQRFSLTFRLKDADEGNSLKVPNIEGCELLFGPATSTMSSVQIINGRQSSSHTVDYTYTYRAVKAGTYSIGPASIVVGNKTLHTSATQLKVLPPDSNSGDSDAYHYGSQQQGQRQDNSVNEVSSKDVFIRIILNKSSAYKEEAIECTMKLYTKYESVSGISAQSPPVFDGFLIEEDNSVAQVTDTEHYNGQNYLTAVLKKYIIFPQKTGKLTINSGKYDINVVQYERVNMGYFSTARPVEKTVHVNPGNLTVDILPLPEPVPADFSGAVGRYRLEPTISSTSLRTNEAATLTLRISGTGDIKYIKDPDITFPDEFELYTPKSDVSANISGGSLSGNATFEYTFVPQAVGEFTIPSYNFVYFNPSTKKYESLSTPEYKLKVAQGASTTAAATTQQDVAVKATDIRHIRPVSDNLSDSAEPIFFKTGYWVIYCILALILTAVCAIYYKRMSLKADIAGRRQAKASKTARKKLAKAKRLLENGKTDAFYDELLKALWGFAADKLNLPVSQLTRQNIAQNLAKAGVSEELTNNMISLIDQCEMAQYTPASSDAELKNTLDEAFKTFKEMA